MATMQPALVDRGAWVRPFGRLVYTMPPYISTDEDLCTITTAIHGALQADH
jgi:adenosylmethionine-8-amino-7-oxononanoate aminotransferase